MLRPGSSDVNLFRNGEGVIDLDTEVPDSAFDLGVTEQELHGSQITSTSVEPWFVVVNGCRIDVGLGRCLRSTRKRAARIVSS
jgi:hypothetical protein